jgi:hypothetical protein
MTRRTGYDTDALLGRSGDAFKPIPLFGRGEIKRHFGAIVSDAELPPGGSRGEP